MANVHDLTPSCCLTCFLSLSCCLCLSQADRQIEMPAVSSLGIQVRVRNLWWGLVLVKQPRLLHRHRHRHRGLLMCWCCVVAAPPRPRHSTRTTLELPAVKYEVGYCARAAARATATYACTQRMSWEPVKCASVPNRRTVGKVCISKQKILRKGNQLVTLTF